MQGLGEDEGVMLGPGDRKLTNCVVVWGNGMSRLKRERIKLVHEKAYWMKGYTESWFSARLEFAKGQKLVD